MQPQLFNFNGQQVRTVTINDEPYFVGKDVATILGYKSPSVAISKNVPDKYKGVTEMETPGGKQKLVIISEAGLYKLAFKSHVPQAERFTDWIASEVLPAIRKHGAYMTDQKAFDVVHNSDGLADLLQQAANQLKEKDVQIAKMKPKALFADAVSTAKTNILIGEMAKILKANGIDHITVNNKQVTMGQNHFFQWLRENGYLIKRKGTDYNAPTQMAMNKKLFKVKESTSINADGTTRINKTTKVTGIGQQYFTNLFLAA
ncbi:phage antirepressor KilAC domain-containing protein [Limosilactobacillus sp. WF-MT5-A]|uniref:phage antirepressor n=1 Tax=Limosilactobacillus agrestis TaxID=2759748 RepID=UPI0015F8F5DF|nr:phage antirepressor KilAC domain-containing protein [Limosilactobacillus agrestis]MBB1099913.1 phage antirepressor KilAC domain-containing protein [Limosilactobacillus agrestis]MCD7120829.1 phage antirepressor KilAC domain-containing protein [Limosilactobacillus agrestis]MCD7126107.1 phage antirepressor KilAC domain-containing protein [Limosilactobacillus agrestis]